MNQYVTGTMIKRLRESGNLTQHQLAEKIGISDKAISKWETGRGYPDISLIEPLADALGVSIIELFSGENVINTNKSFNMLRTKLHVCPVCGNIIQSTGEAVVSCCGITLPPLETEACDAEHQIKKETVEDEYYVTLDHPMTKEHYLSFIAAVSDDGIQLKKLYPEGPCEARFRIRAVRKIYAFCNRHGLFLLKM